MIVSENKFAVHIVHIYESLLEQKWLDASIEMTDEAYKAEMHTYLKTVEQFKLKHALINSKKFGYAITPNIQTWVDQEIATKANKIVEKIAFVVPVDIMSEISIQQTMEEAEAVKYKKIAYFDNSQKALEWLLKK